MAAVTVTTGGLASGNLLFSVQCHNCIYRVLTGGVD